MVLSWPNNVLNLAKVNRPSNVLRVWWIGVLAIALRRKPMYAIAFLTVAGGPIIAMLMDDLVLPPNVRPVLEFLLSGGAFLLLMKILLETREEGRKEREEFRKERETWAALRLAREEAYEKAMQDNTEAMTRIFQWLSGLDESAFCLYRSEKRQSVRSAHRQEEE